MLLQKEKFYLEQGELGTYRASRALIAMARIIKDTEKDKYQEVINSITIAMINIEYPKESLIALRDGFDLMGYKLGYR
jgi:hypothetical protein